MTSVFGDHVPGIPYRPIGELFALYRDRDPAKTAIVDLDSGSAITFGELDRITTEIACLLKSRGVLKGSRVLLLSGGTPMVRLVASKLTPPWFSSSTSSTSS